MLLCSSIEKSLYGLKQATLNWYEKLQEGLIARYFVPSVIDPCFYLKDGTMIFTYVEDCIISGTCMKDIDSFIFSMQHGSENFILTDEGDVKLFLGIEITHNEDYSFELSQPFLINRLLSFLGLCNNEYQTDANKSATPVAKGLLHRQS